ncbi:hypothetical protein [Ornithinimicrobium faecis]|uniref:hypothetical protein n=1 Tax=Ornithinimicrobium faecis TaxID=2934158 RepID=UPI0021195C95|nr:hypothetical protein [Ornithinimicrobium sp. HY1745]
MSMVPPSLFHRLLDDAAVFPPGLAPVEVAVAEFRERANGPYAELIGPLVIGAGAVDELIDVLREAPSAAEPLPVCVIARRGTEPVMLTEAVERLSREVPQQVTLTGVELAHRRGWRDALAWEVPIAVEIGPSTEAMLTQIGDVAEAAQHHRVRAKLRTQSTPQVPLPRPEVLAGFLLGCARRRLPFKLTGGLHHAVPTDVPTPGGGTERQHGLLNVLLATELAVRHARGAATDMESEAATPLERVVATITERDADYLVQRARDLTDDQVSGLRERFTAYGCCGVLDPITELTALGLLSPAS